MDGTIKRLVPERGFGFITSSQGDIFFHRSAVTGSVPFERLTVGLRVSFDSKDSPKGLRAENVRTY